MVFIPRMVSMPATRAESKRQKERSDLNSSLTSQQHSAVQARRPHKTVKS